MADVPNSYRRGKNKLFKTPQIPGTLCGVIYQIPVIEIEAETHFLIYMDDLDAILPGEGDARGLSEDSQENRSCYNG